MSKPAPSATDKLFMGTCRAYALATPKAGRDLTPKEIDITRRALALFHSLSTDELAAVLLVCIYELGQRVASEEANSEQP